METCPPPGTLLYFCILAEPARRSSRVLATDRAFSFPMMYLLKSSVKLAPNIGRPFSMAFWSS